MINKTLIINDFELEQGGRLPELKLAYTTYGEINTDQSNIIWVFHALTANSKVLEWWPGLFGDDCLYSPDEYFIICANILGSPYGSSRPEDLNFPKITIRDTVNAQLALAESLKITKIHTLIGGSCGGSQLLEFAYSYQGQVNQMITIASAPKESPWLIAVHQAQRMALEADPNFGVKSSNTKGLMAARAIGMVTYRTPLSLMQTQKETEEKFDHFKAASYMQYQGEKFAKRFDAMCYHSLTKCLDTHDLGRGRGGYQSALGEIEIPTLVIAIKSDLLIPAFTQSEMASLLPHGVYTEIDSLYGHDGFLLEVKKITKEITLFYQANAKDGTILASY